MSTYNWVEYEQRRIAPKIGTDEVRISSSRISYSLEYDEAMGNPTGVRLLHDVKRNAIGIKPAETDGYKIQRKSKTTREIACKSFIIELKLLTGVYKAKMEGDTIIFLSSEKVRNR
jgi:hypothetical protein